MNGCFLRARLRFVPLRNLDIFCVWLEGAVDVISMFVLSLPFAPLLYVLEGAFSCTAALICQALLARFSNITVWEVIVQVRYRLHANKLNAPHLAQVTLRGLK